MISLRKAAAIGLCLILAAGLAVGQPSTKYPELLLGLTAKGIWAIYPGDCKIKPFKTALLPENALRQSQAGFNESGMSNCEIGKHQKTLFGLKVKSMALGFRADASGQLAVKSVVYKLDGSGLRQELINIYGDPRPAPPPSGPSYSFGTLTIGETTLDKYGESHSHIDFWTRQGFTIQSYSYHFEDYEHMADTSIVRGGLAISLQTLVYIADNVPVPNPPVPNPLLEGLEKNSAAAANGNYTNPQELDEQIKNGQASKCIVVTAPVGAEVGIDGNKVGVSPIAFVLSKQDAPRSITIRMSGYKAIEKKVIPDGKDIRIGVDLEKQ